MLITLEGIDGSGKSTAIEVLREALPAEDTVFTREPTDSWYGEAVDRSINDDSADSMAELFLYTADHADHLSRVIRPALEAGKTVVSDRYSDSRYAYQGVTIADTVEQPMEYIQRVHRPFTRTPDATLYLDVPPETGAERAGATNKFEATEYLERVQANYERLIDAESERFHRIDATRPTDEVAAEVKSTVSQLLENGR